MINRNDLKTKERSSRENFRGNVFVSPLNGEGQALPAQAIIGRPVVSVSDGRRLGSVADILLDPETLTVAAITTSKGTIFNREIEAIRAEQVKVWGQDVVLVEHPQVIQKGSELEGRDKWLSVSDQIRGRYVISVDGTRVGQIEDVVIDAQGKITGYRLNQVFIDGPLADSKRIPASATHSMGRDVLIINTLRGLSGKG